VQNHIILKTIGITSTTFSANSWNLPELTTCQRSENQKAVILVPTITEQRFGTTKLLTKQGI
jgi:hypothetical protein